VIFKFESAYKIVDLYVWPTIASFHKFMDKIDSREINFIQIRFVYGKNKNSNQQTKDGSSSHNWKCLRIFHKNLYNQLYFYSLGFNYFSSPLDTQNKSQGFWIKTFYRVVTFWAEKMPNLEKMPIFWKNISENDNIWYNDLNRLVIATSI